MYCLVLAYSLYVILIHWHLGCIHGLITLKMIRQIELYVDKYLKKKVQYSRNDYFQLNVTFKACLRFRRARVRREYLYTRKRRYATAKNGRFRLGKGGCVCLCVCACVIEGSDFQPWMCCVINLDRIQSTILSIILFIFWPHQGYKWHNLQIWTYMKKSTV